MIETPVLPGREVGEARLPGNGVAVRSLATGVPLIEPAPAAKRRLPGILKRIAGALLALPLLAGGMLLLLNGLLPAVLIAGALLLPALLPLMLVIAGILFAPNVGG